MAPQTNALGYYWRLTEPHCGVLRTEDRLATSTLCACGLLSDNRKAPRKKERLTSDTRVLSVRGVFGLFAYGMLMRQSQGLRSLLGQRENPAVIYL